MNNIVHCTGSWVYHYHPDGRLGRYKFVPRTHNRIVYDHHANLSLFINFIFGDDRFLTLYKSTDGLLWSDCDYSHAGGKIYDNRNMFTRQISTSDAFFINVHDDLSKNIHIITSKDAETFYDVTVPDDLTTPNDFCVIEAGQYRNYFYAYYREVLYRVTYDDVVRANLKNDWHELLKNPVELFIGDIFAPHLMAFASSDSDIITDGGDNSYIIRGNSGQKCSVDSPMHEFHAKSAFSFIIRSEENDLSIGISGNANSIFGIGFLTGNGEFSYFKFDYYFQTYITTVFMIGRKLYVESVDYLYEIAEYCPQSKQLTIRDIENLTPVDFGEI